MPYVVTQSCCADASCVVACPVNCIHPAPGEPGFATAEMLFVDPQACVDCGACATACPVDAVKPHTALRPDQEPFRALNADYFAQFPHADRTPLALVPAQRRLRSPRPARFAVVGAGPAGMYVADELLRHPEITVDVLDRLPTPYGLVRAGVAPDHPDTRRAERLFRAVEEQPGFAYRLGVEMGRDVSLAELEQRYDGVIVTVGAAADRALGIPGEDLPGSLPATEVVAWYNGHPDHQDLAVDLSTERAVVIGNGNVALDVARILTADPDRLARTDVGDVALGALRASRVREVVVLGRRGRAQAAFTLPELIGLVGLDDIDVSVEGLEDGVTGSDARAEILRGLAAREPRPGRRRIVLRFLGQPAAILGRDRVVGVEVARTRLETGPDGRVGAVPTGEREVLETGLVLRAVGYRGRPVPGLPHDEVSGTVPNDSGRVRAGVYVAGWVKRGPTGFIGSNKADAQETVAAILDDLDAGTMPRASSRDDLASLLEARGVQAVDLAGWRVIDAEERARGDATGRPRGRLTDTAAMLRVAAGASRGRSTRRRYASARSGGREKRS